MTIKELKRKPKWKLREEQASILLRQKQIPEDIKVFMANKDALVEQKIAAIKAQNDADEKVADILLEQNESKIKKLQLEYKSNAEILNLYSQVLKNRTEGKGIIFNSLVGLGTSAGILGLTKYVADLSYKSDVEGTLPNKKTLDIYKMLNPFRLIKK